MIKDFFVNIDRQIFFIINEQHSSFMDKIMFFISSNWFWLPVFVLIIFLIIRKYKNKFYIPLVALILCFIITDQSANLSKNNIKRLRPTHNVEINEKVHTVNNYKGGSYGFFSGHAANSFGIALLSILFLSLRIYSIFIIVWAVIVCYSRIYLGVHYPSDIIVGAIYGSLIALFIFYLQKKILVKYLKYEKNNFD